MSKRVGLARRMLLTADDHVTVAPETRALAPDITDVGDTDAIALPRDHPRWAIDRFTVSAATKTLVDRLKPAALRVFCFWDHRTHRIEIDDGVIGIDGAGSYHCGLR